MPKAEKAAEPAPAAGSLAKYRSKRSQGRTPEPIPPASTPKRSQRDAPPTFVIQEHHASSLHWDFRLERDGVLVSWALPKGLPVTPDVNHLAVHVEDHPFEYGKFEGTIPAGEYGAGEVSIWDAGTYELEKWRDREVMVVLHGTRATGRYVLFPTDGNNWMIHRMDPAPEGFEPLPATLAPMLAVADELPRDNHRWAYEFKWDGYRALVWSEGGRARGRSRNGHDLTTAFPELRQVGAAMGTHQVVLDGELVVFDEANRPSFSRLQHRTGLTQPRDVERAAKRDPASYVVFDVLHLDGRSTLGDTYDERRALLEGLGAGGAAWALTPSFVDVPGQRVLKTAVELGMEGVVAKRRDSLYRPGVRSKEWVKVKAERTQEAIVGGWTPGNGNRRGTFGALLLGVPADVKGKLRFIGKVGTGFSDDARADLLEVLAPLVVDESPFDEPLARAVLGGVPTWVRPMLVVEVRFIEWTPDGRLRHPVWRGVRTDKRPKDVVREPKQSVTTEVDGRELVLSNLDKVLYPETGFTKGQVIDYYARIAPVLLPHLIDRPLTMKRWPDGVDHTPFFEKHAPRHAPEWLRTVTVASTAEADPVTYGVISDLASLIWAANLASIEFHVPLWHVGRRRTPPAPPDYMVFDLDPGEGTTIVECCRVAALIAERLVPRHEAVYPKTSGSKGLQLYVPLGPRATWERVRDDALGIAKDVEKERPDLVVSNMRKSLREGKVLIDWSQNHPAKTTVAVYSLRGRPTPSASTPVTWDEVTDCDRAGDPGRLAFTPAETLERVAEHGDLFAPPAV